MHEVHHHPRASVCGSLSASGYVLIGPEGTPADPADQPVRARFFRRRLLDLGASACDAQAAACGRRSADRRAGRDGDRVAARVEELVVGGADGETSRPRRRSAW